MVTSWRVQVVIWLMLWVALTLATRTHHPTLLIAAAAIAFLELGSAASVYANQVILGPRFLSQHRLTKYLSSLFLVIAGSTVGVVTSIQGLYALLWHPDPRRYGLGFNLLSDFVWISLHVIFAVTGKRILRQRSR